MRYLFLLLLFLPLQLYAGPAKYSAVHIRFRDGLPSARVLNTFKKDDFLYVSTQRGLSRYDGYLFVNAVDVGHAVPHFYQVPRGVYFEETGTGLCFKKDIFSKKEILAGVDYSDANPDNDHFQFIFCDKRKYIWCSDFRQVKYLNPNSKTWKFFPVTANGKQEQQLKVRFLPVGDDIMIATTAGLFYWKAADDRLTKLHEASIVSVTSSAQGILLSTADGRLLRFGPGSKAEQVLHREKTPFEFVQIPPDNSVLLAYTADELFSYDLKNHERRTLYKSNAPINHAYYDRQTRGYWLSTENGLIHLYGSNERIEDMEFPDTTAFPLKTIVQDSSGSTWCLSGSSELWELRSKQGWRKWEGKMSEIFLHGNDLFICSGRDMYSISKAGLTKVLSTSFEIKKALFAQDKIWILPGKGRLRVYDAKDKEELVDYLAGDSLFFATFFINDILYAQDKLWLACWAPHDFGIAFLDTVSRKFSPVSQLAVNKQLFVGDYYNRIAEGCRGEILFSAYGGWNSVSGNGAIVRRMQTREQKVANDNIQGIACDSKGNIWFGCAEGLYQYNPTSGRAIQLTELDGLASNNLTNAFFLNSSDELLLSAGNSLQQVNLQEIVRTQLIGKLALSAIIVNDSMWLTAPHRLSVPEAQAGSVTFYFSALSFLDKEKVVYRYRLEGEPWKYLGTEARLQLIKPAHGRYNISVQAGDNLGNWQEKTLRLQLEITPPFYKTSWFFILVILCIVLAAWLINRYLVRQERMKGELKRQVRENENRMLRSQMNPHFLFNSLNSINSFILQSKKEEASEYLTSFSRLIRRILDHSQREYVALSEELDTINIYLKLESARLDGKFDYSIHVRNLAMATTDLLIPPLILQPFLENAIWHGISHKRGRGFIDVVVRRDEAETNRLLICIIDDGVGREASARIEGNRKRHQSHGMNITVARLMNSDPGNKVEIIDLKDERGNPAGTQVSLKILFHYD